MKKISFIIPSRNNLKYVQQAYQSIKNSTGNKHEIVLLDDASTDGTWEWMKSISEQDNQVIIYRNGGPERVGHTILYDKGIELSTSEVFSILHADMIITPNYVDNLVKHLKPKTVVCATRIEPPLHPPGPEKHVKLFGTEPEEFKKDEFIEFVKEEEERSKNKTTRGIFAPWCMYKEDFIGHDPLFAPMELEDSDLFNRFLLNGYELIQSRDSLVYHMTCRGSRFKDGLEIEREIPLPDGTIWYKPKDSEEYIKLRQIKFREWYRKWHQNVLHDELMMPIVNPVLNVGIIAKNCNINALAFLEQHCDNIYVDCEYASYIAVEQTNTLFNLNERIRQIEYEITNDVIVELDCSKITQEDIQVITNLGEIVIGTNETGKFQVGNLIVTINSLNDRSKELIFIDNDKHS
jgi:glycosyltransferase involved in cell wall biosynthesis